MVEILRFVQVAIVCIMDHTLSVYIMDHTLSVYIMNHTLSVYITNHTLSVYIMVHTLSVCGPCTQRVFCNYEADIIIFKLYILISFI